MIEVTPNTAIVLYLALTLSTILGVWIAAHLARRKKKVIIAEKELYLCEYCLTAYLDEKIKGVTRCPNCLSFNKENRYNPLGLNKEK